MTGRMVDPTTPIPPPQFAAQVGGDASPWGRGANPDVAFARCLEVSYQAALDDALWPANDWRCGR